MKTEKGSEGIAVEKRNRGLKERRESVNKEMRDKMVESRGE